MGIGNFIKRLKFLASNEIIEMLQQMVDSQETEELGKIKKRLNDISKVHNNFVDELNNSKKNVRDIKKEVDRQKEYIQNSVKEFEENLNNLEKIMEQHNQQEDSKSKLQDYERQITELKQIVANLVKHNQDLERKVDQLVQKTNTGFGQQMAVIQQEKDALNMELNQYKVAYQNVANNLQQAELDNKKLEQKLSNIEQNQHQKEEQLADAEINPFQLEPLKECITADNIGTFLHNIQNTEKLDVILNNVDEDNSYKKMFARYKKNIIKCVERLDEEDELEDSLSSILDCIQGELLKKIVIAIYLGSRKGNFSFEQELLAGVNAYLSRNGFYTRNDIVIGEQIREKDYEDMEFVKGESLEGKKAGTIVEVQLYPYYLNYIDEDGEQQNIHTQGMMIVSA